VNVPSTVIPGVMFGTLQRHADVRGGFAEAWRARGAAEIDPFPGVQANLSSSAQGVLRGLHLHQHQWDLWIVLSGVAFVALVDVRPMLAGADRPAVETVTMRRDQTVRIPPHIAHGFLAVEPLELLYLVTNEYDASDERGIAWDDAHASVPWPRVATPDGRPILSDRDERNPSLASLVADIAAPGGSGPSGPHLPARP
jgi:dTDP-4-dehydrorhamnose 3,5-epimerase